MNVNRRELLLGTAGLLAASGLLPRALAQGAPTELGFLFVFVGGGWDTTKAFAPVFDNPNVDLEPDATRAQAGGIAFVDHVTRPSVRTFFERHHRRTLVLNGLTVPSVQHEVCTRLVLTGESREGYADWGTRIGASSQDAFTLPNLVLGGPSFPADLATASARTGSGGQLEGLISGDVIRTSVMPTGRLSGPAEATVDRWLARRTGARALSSRGEREAALVRAYDAAVARSVSLKDLRYTTDFSTTPDLLLQAEVAIDALAQGVSRTASIVDVGGQLGWDTHSNNDAQQAQLHEALFNGLDRILAMLDATPGRTRASLADETVVVVLSEMGRTPRRNAVLGKDHWPSTSAMLVGPGLTTDRVVGAYDDGFYGRKVDPGTGEVTDTGVELGTRSLGATLLALAGLDPATELPGVPVLTGLLA